MLKQENAKLNLYKILTVFVIGFFINACNLGGGDEYRSMICYGYHCSPDSMTPDEDLYYYWVEVSPDRRKVRYGEAESAFTGSGYSKVVTDWIDLKNGGVGYIELYGNMAPVFEIKDGKVRVTVYGSTWGDWADLCAESDVSYAKKIDGVSTTEVKVEINNGKFRWCEKDDWSLPRSSPAYNTWVCGNWVEFDRDYVCGSKCPEGYTYNSLRGVCEAEPVCNNGIYDPTLKKCYVGDFSCPLGDYECLKLADGKRYCSLHPCADATDPSNYTNTDTVEGANDKQADGEIDENGNCLGTIYIFNGNDYRCRPPGVQTGFSDCCKKTSTWFGLGQCKPREKILAKMRTTNKGKEYTLADARCHYVGSYCAEEWMGTCVQRKKTFCCFGSVLARILHEQGRPQIGLSWGDPKNPICRGFTPAELQSIDFGKIDFSEYENFMQDEINEKFKPQDVQQNMQDKIQDFYDNNVN